MLKTLFLFLALLICRTELGFAEIKIFGKYVIPEEGRKTSGMFVIPNEIYPHAFEPVLRKKSGTYLTVGTIRSVVTSSFGNFSHIFVVDHDLAVKRFNDWNLTLIASSADRFEYMLKLLGVRRNATLLRMVKDRIVDEREFLDISKRFQKSDPMLGEFHSHLPPDSGVFNRPLANILLHWSQTETLWKKTLFGSDEQFAIAKEKITSDSVINLVGDFAGSQTLASLGSAMRSENRNFSVIDLSDLLMAESQDPKGVRLQTILSNIRALPLANDAVVLLTHITHPFLPADSDWLYFAMPAQEFLTAFSEKLSAESVPVAYKQLIEDLFKSRAPVNDFHERLVVTQPLCASILSGKLFVKP